MNEASIIVNGMRTVSFFLCLILSTQLFCHAQDADKRRSDLAAHLNAAQKYLSEKQPQKAIPELQAVVALEPGNLEVQANLGVLLYFQGRFSDALPHLKAAIAIKPDLWKIRSLLGISERRVGSEADGRSDLEAVFPQLDNDPKLKITVGRDLIESYASADELDKASQTIDTILKLEPTDPALLYISYRIHSDMATAAMLEMGLAAPDSAQTHQAMAHEMQRDHDLAGTIANLRKALELDPALPGAHFELAEALHASDDQRLRAEAEGEYKLAVSTDPSDPKAAYRLADVEVEKGDLADAATEYRAALVLQPGSADAAIGLANVLSEQGKPKEALPLLLQVEAADPTNSLAHFRLSAVYRKLNQPDDVKRELALYQRYKEEREKLKAIYAQMRVLTPDNDTEKK
jgi:tetratricopeptide (TPR) repeat protein